MRIDTMIELSHVTMHYKKGPPTLMDLSFKVRRGEFVVLSGPSGAGKTTLFKLLYAAEPPTRGLVLVNEINVPRLDASTLPLFRRSLGIVFQDYKLLEDQTVFDNLALVLDATGASYQKINTRIQITLACLGMRNAIKEKIKNLSGGEQQRVAIARSIVHEPLLLLADEPTGNLDPETSRDVISLFSEMNRSGTTVVLATHNLELTKSINTRNLHLDSGRLIRHQGKGTYSGR